MQLHEYDHAFASSRSRYVVKCEVNVTTQSVIMPFTYQHVVSLYCITTAIFAGLSMAIEGSSIVLVAGIVSLAVTPIVLLQRFQLSRMSSKSLAVSSARSLSLLSFHFILTSLS